MKNTKYFLFTFLFFAVPALADAQVASIVFTTTPQTVAPGSVSDVFTLQAQEAGGNAVAGGIPSTGCIALTSTSPTGQFSSSATSWNPITTLTMNKASSNRNFYYQDATAGNYTLSISFALKPTTVTAACSSWPQGDWGTVIHASQNITVGTGASTPVVPPASSQSSDDPSATLATEQTVTSVAGASSAVLGASIKTERVVIAAGGSFFEGSAFDTDGDAIAGARYVWNFGDGSIDEGQTVFHTYVYPGTYVANLSVASGSQAGITRTTIEVLPVQLGLLVEPDGSVVLSNQSSQEINIGLWSLTSGTSTFVLPENTILLSGENIHFSTAVMHMLAAQDIALRYPNGVSAAVTMPHASVVSPIYAAVLSPPQAPSSSVSIRAASVSHSKTVFSNISTTSPNVAAAAAESGTGVPLWSWILGAGGIILIGIGAFSYATYRPKKVTNASADEFEIEG